MLVNFHRFRVSLKLQVDCGELFYLSVLEERWLFGLLLDEKEEG